MPCSDYILCSLRPIPCDSERQRAVRKCSLPPALDGIKSYTSVIAQLINPIVFSIKRLTFATKITFFSRNHQENHKKSATHQQNLRNPQTEQVKICVICELKIGGRREICPQDPLNRGK